LTHHVTMIHSSNRSNYIPSKGDRLELKKLGLILRGTVLYADQLQVLVKWDNGRSSSLRAGVDDLDVTYTEVTSHALVPSW
jgi:hypothetical protein